MKELTFQGKKFELRIAVQADVPALRLLVNSAYKELSDMGLNYTATYQDEKTTLERINKGRAFIVSDSQEIIGTILFSAENHKTGRKTAYVGQFAVDPKFKKMGLGSYLMDHCEKLAEDEGFVGIQLDTAIPATHLVQWYQKRGYEVVDTVHWEGKTYDSYILEKLFSNGVKEPHQDLNWPNHFSRFVAHYSTRTEASPPKEIPSYFIRVIDSDIGRSVGFNRIAVHHIVLPPGCRTSSPHAESLEEEFVFVLKGKPDLWLNGYVHNLSEHYAVGFPAGTGIAHTFINNTTEDIHLIVAGDRNKKENLCSFPINPELKESCKIWWDNPPSHSLGLHNGLPGPIKDSERAKEPSQFIFDCKAQGKRKPFHYPGDNETFGEGFRLTDHIGLKNLGISYDYLPSGTRSAFPHAHTHEEEFVYVLQGWPTVWLDGFTKTLAADEFAAFPSNTGLSHCLINDSDDEVIYLCIGETQEFPTEKINYPLNPLRQKECRRKGWYWDDLKTPVSGSLSSKSDKYKKEHLEFQVCAESDAELVLEIFKRSPTYFQRVDGCLPTLQMAKHAIVDGPKEQGEGYFKECLIIKLNNQPIGILDVHANHPEKEICYLGLILIVEELFSHGLGRKCYELAEDYVLRAFGCKKIRLGISNDNDVSGFWQKMGFEFNGKTYDWKGEQKIATVREFDKDLKVKSV